MHLLLLATLLPTAPAPSATAGSFDPAAFFAGRTEGTGVLRRIASGPRPFTVSSNGRRDADRTLVVEQRVAFAGRASTTRAWRLREVAPGRWAGTLTGTGPIVGEVRGERLDLSYRMAGGLDVRQALTMAPDGRSARNLMTVRKFGIVVARLEETIRKLD